MKNINIEKIIQEINNIALIATKLACRFEKDFEIKSDIKKARKALNEIKWISFPLNGADGMTVWKNKTIMWNSNNCKKWSENYYKMVLLHELAHYFTHEVSGVSSGHCRTWFYWQHFFNKVAFGVEKATDISYYNLAKYTGPLRDSSIEYILKFGKRIGVNSVDQINYDILGIKNYCSNILKKLETHQTMLEWHPTPEQTKIHSMNENERKEYINQKTKEAAIKLGYLDEKGNLIEQHINHKKIKETVDKNISLEAREIIQGRYLINFKERTINKFNVLNKQVEICTDKSRNVSEEKTIELYKQWKKQQEQIKNKQENKKVVPVVRSR